MRIIQKFRYKWKKYNIGNAYKRGNSTRETKKWNTEISMTATKTHEAQMYFGKVQL